MAFFQQKRAQEQATRRMRSFSDVESLTDEAEYEEDGAEGFRDDPLYDDGLYEDDYGPGEFGAPDWDEDAEDPDANEEWTEEELAEERKHKFRILSGVGDLTAILVGVAVILVLSALLIQMVHFATSDLSQNFTLFATHF